MTFSKKNETVLPNSRKMVKSKRDLTTPRRRVSLTKNRTIAKVIARPNSGASSIAAPTPAANIRVVVRVRPPNHREQDDNSRIVVKVVDDQMLIFDPKEDAQAFFFHGVQQKGRDLLKKSHKDLQFMFDKVFSSDASTHEVFQHSTHSLIKSLMDGYNCSVFAYGATGAGKTFTMTGTTECPGITFLTMTELFKKREDLSVERDFEVGITYLEVYNELVKDLLKPGPPLNLREDTKYGVTVAGISIYKIKNPEELFTLLDQGNKNRTQHPTDANAESSRSHAVFQVYLQMTMKSSKEIRTAKLSMIDLAGSERGSATGFVGARFTEGANINKSLLALGNCINSLADGLRHVPYRDSKLTRLLKDSLGGNCQTVMIANVSPSSLTFEDTYNTLKYATRAKNIKSNIKRNVVSVDLHVGQYVKIVEDQKKEIMMLKGELEEERKKVNNYSNLMEENLKLKKESEELKNKMNIDSNLILENNKLKEKLEKICDFGGIDIVVNEETIAEMKELIEKKKLHLERQYQLEKCENGTALRRIIKQEIDARLSDIMTNSPDKEEAHYKIGMSVDRFKKQECAIKEDIELEENFQVEVDSKLDQIAEDHPQLRNYINVQKLNLKLLEARYQNELSARQIDIVCDDQKEKSILLEEMAVLLKNCYKQLKGHGFATESLTQQYQNIVLSFQGKKNIKWGHEILDSGVSSSSSISSTSDKIKTSGSKRKIEEAPAVDFDETFTLPTNVTTNKPKVKLCADQIMAKVLKPPPAKKMAGQLNTKSPGNVDRRQLLSHVDTARSVAVAKAIVTAKKVNYAMKAKAKTSTKTQPLAERPRFRR